MIKPDCYLYIGKIIDAVEREFTLGNLKMFRLGNDAAQHFYA